MDLSRIALIFGAGVIAVPLMWNRPDALAELGGDPAVTTSGALIYLFSVWTSLIAFSLIFSWAVRRWAGHWVQAGEGVSGETTKADETGRGKSGMLAFDASQENSR